MAADPAKTPPAHVHLMSHEQLVAEVLELRRREAEAYKFQRDLSNRVDTNHLVTLDCLGQIARMCGGQLVLPKGTP